MEPTQNGTTPRRERPLVLVADDMQLQVRLTRLHLERAGCDVAAVADGVEALAFCEASSPHLILLDVEMPGLNGFQVLDRLRKSEATRAIPVIMLTAHAKDASLFAEWAESADLFMTKPFTPSDLISRVQRILGLAPGSAGAPPS